MAGTDLEGARVRQAFPALAHGVAHFDGPGGSQVPAVVAQAVADTMVAGIANRGSVTAAEQRAEETVAGARQAVADLSAEARQRLEPRQHRRGAGHRVR